jgi:cytochrome c peroxidase
MKKARIGSWAAVVPILVVLGCGSSAESDTGEFFSAAEWTKIRELGPLADLPADTTNRYADDATAARFGQELFFEKSYSGQLQVGDDGTNGALGVVGEKGKVACASCHLPTSWWMDTRTQPNNMSLGVAYTERNAPSLVNAAYYKWFGWAGKQDSLWCQASGSPESKDNTAGNRLQYAHMVFAKYRADYDAIFPVPLDPALDPNAPDAARFPLSGKPKAAATDPDGPWELMTAEDRQIILTIMTNCGKSMAAYERKLISKNAPFDRFVQGDASALSTSAKNGLKLFIGKAACNACHKTTTFSDNEFHTTGVPQQVGDHVPTADDGRFTDLGKVLSNAYNGTSQFSDDLAAGHAKLDGLAPLDADKGKFRTKSLRHVAETAPYMHNGSMKTLEEVVHFYNLGGGDSGFTGTKDAKILPLNLTAGEQADLVAFLKSLTGEPIPADLAQDTAVP